MGGITMMDYIVWTGSRWGWKRWEKVKISVVNALNVFEFTKWLEPGVVAHVCNLSTQETEVGRSLWVW
jgi:hypothetical protein